MKWAFRNKTAEKGQNCDFQAVGSLLYAHYPIYFFLLFDFQAVGSLLYAHYPIYFFLLFEQYYQGLCCVKIQEKV